MEMTKTIEISVYDLQELRNENKNLREENRKLKEKLEKREKDWREGNIVDARNG